MYSIILAGGSGSRLWPLSRELYPKKLLNIQNKDSLLQETLKRIVDFVPAQNIVSITNTKHNANVRYQLSSIVKNPVVLSEPIAKNTASAIAVSVKYLLDRCSDIKDEVVLVVPSDHKINDVEKFKESILKGEALAKEGYLVTFGVKPEYAETGFGYIQVDNKINDNGFKVKSFVEKPDSYSAEKYLNEEGMYWNSGIFMFKPSVFMNELQKYSPEIFDCVIVAVTLSDLLPIVAGSVAVASSPTSPDDSPTVYVSVIAALSIADAAIWNPAPVPVSPAAISAFVHVLPSSSVPLYVPTVTVFPFLEAPFHPAFQLDAS